MKTKRINEEYRLLLIDTIQFFELYLFKIKKNELSLSSNEFHLVVGIKDNAFRKDKLSLTIEQLKLFIVILDYANRNFLDNYPPPYNSHEMDFFKSSEKFMKKYNIYGDINQLLEHIKSNQQLVLV